MKVSRVMRGGPRRRKRPGRAGGLSLVLAGTGVLGLVFLAPPSARAQWIVHDPVATVQASITAGNSGLQLEQLLEQSRKQLEQLQIAIEQRDALRGARGLGALLNGAAEKASRRALPAKFDQLLELAEGWDREVGALRSRKEGRALGEADVRAVLQSLLSGLELAGADGVYPNDPQGPAGLRYERERNTAATTYAVAQKAYDDVARRVESYELLLAQIDQSEDLKASLDLQNRIAVENGLTALETIRVSAAATASRKARS